MPDMIPCSECGLKNRLGLLFCSRCGAKLDLSKRRSGSASSGLSGAGSIFRMVIALAFLIVLGLLCWPAAPDGDAPAAGGAQAILAKSRALRGAVTRGNEIVEQFDEAQINHYLSAKLASAEKPEGLKLHLREIRAQITPGNAGVWMKSELFSLPITYAVPVRIARRPDGSHTFSPGTVRIGHLPLPGPLNTRALDQIAAVFARMNEEREFMNMFPEVELLDGIIEVSTAATATPNPENTP